ncbi:hypothetical protein CAOG_04183 [Capsaspora owczarzaki ATCC 30864]|uniref:Uncharacterized protein n=1 Tax=Capsaspora owczarzaki (strain ATCC 30864) TaxID=595528 RepID=A0A0D2WPL4_CAPO3|nr:hypothetical protein CAOG_04183 [Capsaspora owczarzaki ATCC 30864]KJE93390.1 hypothetical protein CAOG_004183 [Capsaspora owczarzaki ATCC 30864]|eukprot:XP_004348008.1 hypothetical protein CAOG_04183 [Capsaspora owczarzaki ATCC 30864]
MASSSSWSSVAGAAVAADPLSAAAVMARLDHLWNAAHSVCATSPAVARTMMYEFLALARAASVRLPGAVTRRVCTCCGNMLLPGLAGTQVRLVATSIKKKSKKSKSMAQLKQAESSRVNGRTTSGSTNSDTTTNAAAGLGKPAAATASKRTLRRRAMRSHHGMAADRSEPGKATPANASGKPNRQPPTSTPSTNARPAKARRRQRDYIIVKHPGENANEGNAGPSAPFKFSLTDPFGINSAATAQPVPVNHLHVTCGACSTRHIHPGGFGPTRRGAQSAAAAAAVVAAGATPPPQRATAAVPLTVARSAPASAVQSPAASPKPTPGGTMSPVPSSSSSAVPAVAAVASALHAKSLPASALTSRQASPFATPTSSVPPSPAFGKPAGSPSTLPAKPAPAKPAAGKSKSLKALLVQSKAPAGGQPPSDSGGASLLDFLSSL